MAVLLLSVASIVVLATPDGQPTDWLNVLLMSLGSVGCVWYVFDGTNARRQAILSETELIVGGDMGKYSVPTIYKLDQIPGAAIVMPEESGWPSPGLYFHYEDKEEVVGIGEQVELPRLAKAIHDSGIPIRLHGWDPATSQDVAETFSWERDRGNGDRSAKMEILGEDQVSLMSPLPMISAITQQCLPFLIWLFSVGYMIWYLYQNWNALIGYEWIIVLAVTIFGMMVMAQITERYSTAATSRTLGKMVRRQVKRRTGCQIDVDSPDNFEIEVREPDQFDKTVFKIRETALVQVDRHRLLFEGKKERWCIPASSLKAVRLQEVQIGTPGESAVSILLYFVVISFATQDGEFEYGLRDDARDFGAFDDTKRATAGVRLYEAVASIVE